MQSQIDNPKAVRVRTHLALHVAFLLIALGVAGPISAQPLDEQRWENVRELLLGEGVQVVDLNLKTLKGRFLAYSEEAISLQDHESKQAVTIPRSQVLRVSSNKGGRKENALIGATILPLGGLALFYASGHYTPGDISHKAFLAVALPIWGATGAGVGAAFTKYHTVYRATSPQKGDKRPTN